MIENNEIELVPESQKGYGTYFHIHTDFSV